MEALPCIYRLAISQAEASFRCDHPQVYVDDQLVDEGVCAACRFRESSLNGGGGRKQPHRATPARSSGAVKTRKRLAFLAGTDFANVSTQWAKAIREHSQLLEAASICLRPHSFEYDLKHDFDLSPHTHSPGRGRSWEDLITPERATAARGYLEQADYVVQADELASHELFSLFQQLVGVELDKLPLSRKATYHGGTAFRNDWRNRNRRDERFRAQLTHPDLYRLGGRNARPAFPVLENIPTDAEIHAKFRGDRLVIVHSPSNQAVKGLRRRSSCRRCKADLRLLPRPIALLEPSSESRRLLARCALLDGDRAATVSARTPSRTELAFATRTV